MWRALILVLAVICAGGPSAASPQAQASAAYQAGEYLVAVRLAEAAGTPADHTLAARALIAEAVTRGDRTTMDGMLRRAVNHAETAIRADRESVEARLQLAVALGMKGRRASALQALRAGWAPRGKRLLEEAIALDPNEAWAHALLGGWHLEVVRRGGAAGAAMFGANFEAGRAAFERARQMAPQEGAIAYHYAIALLEQDAQRYGKEAGVLLNAASACGPKDAFQVHIMQESLRIQAVLSAQGPEAAALAAARDFQ
jgi:hypothetical protein